MQDLETIWLRQKQKKKKHILQSVKGKYIRLQRIQGGKYSGIGEIQINHKFYYLYVYLHQCTQQKELQQEHLILRKINDQHIDNIQFCQLIDWFYQNKKTKYYLVFRKEQHNLKNLMEKHDYDSQQIKKIVKDLINTVYYLHYKLYNKTIINKQVHKDPTIKGVLLRNISFQNVYINKKKNAIILNYINAKKCNIYKPMQFQQFNKNEYRAPQLLKKIRYNAAADVFSLGITIYQIILNGKNNNLWDSSQHSPNHRLEMMKHMYEEEKILKNIQIQKSEYSQSTAKFWSKLISKCLCYKEEDRWSLFQLNEYYEKNCNKIEKNMPKQVQLQFYLQKFYQEQKIFSCEKLIQSMIQFRCLKNTHIHFFHQNVLLILAIAYYQYLNEQNKQVRKFNINLSEIVIETKKIFSLYTNIIKKKIKNQLKQNTNNKNNIKNKQKMQNKSIEIQQIYETLIQVDKKIPQLKYLFEYSQQQSLYNNQDNHQATLKPSKNILYYLKAYAIQLFTQNKLQDYKKQLSDREIQGNYLNIIGSILLLFNPFNMFCNYYEQLQAQNQQNSITTYVKQNKDNNNLNSQKMSIVDQAQYTFKIYLFRFIQLSQNYHFISNCISKLRNN